MLRRERIIRSNYKALYGPLMEQGWALTLWGSACVSLESIGMFFGTLNGTRASRNTGAKGSNFFAINNRLQITNDHMERIGLQVSAKNK